MTDKIYICHNCHTPLHKPISVYPKRAFSDTQINFCNKICRRQWNKLSIEEKRQLFWQTRRQEFEVNQLDLFNGQF